MTGRHRAAPVRSPLRGLLVALPISVALWAVILWSFL